MQNPAPVVYVTPQQLQSVAEQLDEGAAAPQHAPPTAAETFIPFVSKPEPSDDSTTPTIEFSDYFF